jgi:crotonobetainyl-CoA:carnitine CoA-transferase CaiB-like acyl-CoA transferase
MCRFQKICACHRPAGFCGNPTYLTNNGRAENAEYLDQVIEEWTRKHSQKEVQKILDEAGVPVGPIYNIEDIVRDEHYQARDMLQTVTLPDGEQVLVPGIVPKLSETPGSIEWIGPELGQHNKEVLEGKKLNQQK